MNKKKILMGYLLLSLVLASKISVDGVTLYKFVDSGTSIYVTKFAPTTISTFGHIWGVPVYGNMVK